MFHGYVQLPEGNPPFSYGISMIFPRCPWFSYGFLMVSFDFPLFFLKQSQMFHSFPVVSYGFPMIFPSFHCFPMGVVYQKALVNGAIHSTGLACSSRCTTAAALEAEHNSRSLVALERPGSWKNIRKTIDII